MITRKKTYPSFLPEGQRYLVHKNSQVSGPYYSAHTQVGKAPLIMKSLAYIVRNGQLKTFTTPEVENIEELPKKINFKKQPKEVMEKLARDLFPDYEITIVMTEDNSDSESEDEESESEEEEDTSPKLKLTKINLT